MDEARDLTESGAIACALPKDQAIAFSIKNDRVLRRALGRAGVVTGTITGAAGRAAATPAANALNRSPPLP